MATTQQDRDARALRSAKHRSLTLRLDMTTADDIEVAAEILGVSKSAWAREVLHDAAARVVARADRTLMDAELFDHMMATIDTPDPMPALVEAMRGAPDLDVR
ncbi:DUF1778 domain-containing protein [Phycicoccus sp. CSK15P-2]|uniref:type II toxin -antitoxin system TacA 1-like antitoxin n=1 Tax=Phycicoccus sp. CSK15P-2 TaxID=2807627 RepID=UPI0019529D21|nr:DUF1778 domain-containing protein [Phycicoccus sp. CSK15P-2]MBM6404375.1 DUF1778 domain-containing protein [Phycicoccus sp. CSK15P-2]